MSTTPRSVTPGAALVLCAPLGPAGVALLLTHFLPHMGLPVIIPWEARPGVGLGFWAALTLSFYGAFVVGNPEFRKFARPGSAVGRLLKGALLVVGHLFVVWLLSIIAGMLLMPSLVLVGAVVLLASSDGLPQGHYAHRVLSDLLMVYSLVGVLVGGRVLMKAWGAGVENPFGRAPRWLGSLLLAGLLLGALGMAWAGFLGRTNPGVLTGIFEPKPER